MAQGDLLTFDAARKNISGLLDLSNGSDYSLILITTLPLANQATPDSADFTECTVGGSYAGPVALVSTWIQAGAVVTFDAADPADWLAAPGSPTNIVAALIYSETAVGEDALCFIDMTVDGGTTPVSMVDGKISIAFNASGLFSIGL